MEAENKTYLRSTTTTTQGVTLSGPACVCNDGKPPSLLSSGQKCGSATASPTCMTTYVPQNPEAYTYWMLTCLHHRSYTTSTTSTLDWGGEGITTISFSAWNCSCNDWATQSILEPSKTCGTLTAPTNCDLSMFDSPPSLFVANFFQMT